MPAFDANELYKERYEQLMKDRGIRWLGIRGELRSPDGRGAVPT